MLYSYSVTVDGLQSTYHGVINDDALPGDEVRLDRPIVVTNWDTLIGGLFN